MFRNLVVRLASFVCLLALPGLVLACQYDRDCRPGVKCVKARGNMYGACQSVAVSGDSRASLDEKGKLDVHQTYSRSCRVDSECPLDYRCSRVSGASSGVCIRTGVLLPGSIRQEGKVGAKLDAKDAAKAGVKPGAK